jgi:UPF0755 protein
VRQLLVLAAVLALVTAAVIWYGWNRYQEFLGQPLDVSSPGLVLNVDPGLSGRAVISRIVALGLSKTEWQWRLLMRLEPVIIQAGEYQLEPGITPIRLLRKLESGDVIRYRFTIVEGWTYPQVFEAVRADPILGQQVLEPLKDGAVLETVADGESAEGVLLPETYLFTRTDTARGVLQRAADAMRIALFEAWATRVAAHPAQTPYELLILASIIEKETALDEERAEISGVFVRRLQQGMKLQTDPSVIYGLGEAFDGDIRREDLKNDTPYNTYTRHGLPPTPIAMPSRASLLAAAQPAAGDTLYFVADGKGGHTFSTTLEEHQQGVNKLTGKN